MVLSNIFLVDLNSDSEEPTYPSDAEVKADKKTLILKQKEDCRLSKIYTRASSEKEAEKLRICSYFHEGVLMGKWRPHDVPASDHWQVKEKIVVRKEYRLDIVNQAYDIPLAGHLGVRKTKYRILQHFYWPSLSSDIASYCRTCKTFCSTSTRTSVSLVYAFLFSGKNALDYAQALILFSATSPPFTFIHADHVADD
ncbi:Hypothetical predicted protein [Octopus vulgaris]|uniref:Integrase zinc-binding domain-containing protein n=1 Tax=Octopus vulgaris TaxID=6645 RepID=A0AA36AZH4_OCTVU|nr:Hypothetical predicted protein [Octopus vulgaris]